jgi:hypothetical protein
MCKKGYKQTEEHRRKIGISNIGNLNMLGKHHTEETKRKIGDAQLGDKNHCFGKQHTEEHKKKISENHADMSGEKNPMFGRSREKSPTWNPDKTDEERLIGRTYPEYYGWRLQVYEKDNYTCQKCGDNKGGNLEAHHIEGYSFNKELQTVVDNGITFCKSCHKEFHRIYGVESTTEKVNNFMSGRGYQKLNGETKL